MGVDLAGLVGDQDDGHALVRKLPHDLEDPGLGADIDPDGGAVENEDARIGGQPFGDRDPLLLAARERVHRQVRRADLGAQARDPVGAEIPGASRAEIEPGPGQGRQGGDRRVADDGSGLVQAEIEAVFRQVGHTGADRVAIGAETHRLAINGERAGIRRGHAEDRLCNLGSPGAEQPGQAEDLALPQREADVVIFSAPGQVPEFEHGVAEAGSAARRLLDFEPGHEARQLARGHAVGRIGADKRTVAQDGHARADLDHLGQPVADENDGDPAFRQAPDDGEQVFRFRPGQRGGGLVHEDDPRLGPQHARNRHELPLGDAERRELGGGGDLDAKLLEGLRRAGMNIPPPLRLQRAGDEVVEHHVLGHAEIGEERQVLPNDVNPALLRLGGRNAPHRLRIAKAERGARIGRIDTVYDLDQGALAAVILADDAVHLTAFQVEIDRVESLQGSESLGDRSGPDRVVFHCLFFRSWPAILSCGAQRRYLRGPVRGRASGVVWFRGPGRPARPPFRCSARSEGWRRCWCRPA